MSSISIRLCHGKGAIAFFLLYLIISGCATDLTSKTERDPAQESRAVIRFSYFAEQYEKKGDLRRALQYWEIVSGLSPTNAEVRKKIADMKAQILDAAARHFRRGLSYYEQHATYDARREFLLSLSLNPDNEVALEYLKNRLAGEDVSLYTVKKGDTVKGIAQKTYGDPQKGFLISYFNNLGSNAKLSPGSVLTVPLLEPALMGKQVETSPEEVIPKTAEKKIIAGMGPETKGAMAEAKSFYESREYLRSIALTEKILQSDASRRDARDLMNAACYQRGKGLMKEEKYESALRMFACAEPGYKDVKNLEAVARKRLADSHYIRGVELFMYEKLDEAIEEWKITLNIDPNHPKAASDIENAHGLLMKLNEIR